MRDLRTRDCGSRCSRRLDLAFIKTGRAGRQRSGLALPSRAGRRRLCNRLRLRHGQRAGLADTDKRCALPRQHYSVAILLCRVRGAQRLRLPRTTIRSSEGELAGSSEELRGARILSGNDDLGAAQAQIESIEQCEMSKKIIARARQDPCDQPIGLLSPGVLRR